MKKEISIIIPVYNEEGNLEELYRRLISVLVKIDDTYEVIFIDDGSTDNSWEIISKLYKEDDNIKGIKFSRNFGHQFALKAGYEYSDGNATVSIDADLQQSPELILEMYDKWKEGYDIVQAVRKNTKGALFFKKFFSKLFYKTINFLSETKIKPGSSDFRLLDYKVVKEIKNLKENQLFLRGIISWIGYESYYLEYSADKRFSGETKYSYRKMLRLAVDGIMSFSIKPLRLVIFLGFFTTLLAFIYLVYVFVVRLTAQIDAGWASILASILFLGGIQLISLGIIGEYIGRLYIENKNRRNFIIEEIKS